jgi:hypothetical protein
MLPPTQIPLVAGVIINKPTTIPLSKLFSRAPALKNLEQLAERDTRIVEAQRLIEITRQQVLLHHFATRSPVNSAR